MGRSVDRSVGRSVGWLARIISGLKETFIKRYIVEKTNEAEIRPEEQSEKAESCRENLWKEIQVQNTQEIKSTLFNWTK